MVGRGGAQLALLDGSEIYLSRIKERGGGNVEWGSTFLKNERFVLNVFRFLFLCFLKVLPEESGGLAGHRHPLQLRGELYRADEIRELTH